MDNVNIAKNEISTVLQKHYQSQSFKLLEWKMVSLNENGRMGYLGDHLNVEATVQFKGHDVEKVSFFVKIMPANPIQRELVESCLMFRKETLFYHQVVDDFISLLLEIYPESKTFVVPRCYLTSDTMLILQDLRALNFKGLNAVTSLSLDFFLVAMRAIGQFHAVSLAMEEKLRKPLSEAFPDLDFETFLDSSPNHYLAGWHAAALDAVCALVPMLDRYKGNSEIVKEIQDAFPHLMDELVNKFRAWPDERNVFCHGDLWINNFLFRTDQDGKPVEAVLVDFQMSRYAPPAADIVMFLLFCVDKDFRNTHANNGLREYHSALSRTLLQLGMQPDKIFPWEDLLRTVQNMQKYGLILMTMEYPFALAPAELLEPIFLDTEAYRKHFLVSRTHFVVNLFKENDAFRSRISEILEEIITDYILKS